MLTDTLFIVGAGGHGRVVLDTVMSQPECHGQIRLRDDALFAKGALVLGCLVECPAVSHELASACFHVAIGDNRGRRRLWDACVAVGGHPLTVRHPDSTISRHSKIADGAFIAARCVVGPGASIGSGVILNHGVVVDHDCIVREFAHIAPNATLGGGVRVGVFALVGAGANILPGIVLGDGAVVGAGAVVTRNVEAGEVVAGVPARRIEESKNG